MMIFNLIKKDILIVKKYVLIMFAATVLIPPFMLWRAPEYTGIFGFILSTIFCVLMLLQYVSLKEYQFPKAATLLCAAPVSRKVHPITDKIFDRNILAVYIPGGNGHGFLLPEKQAEGNNIQKFLPYVALVNADLAAGIPGGLPQGGQRDGLNALVSCKVGIGCRRMNGCFAALPADEIIPGSFGKFYVFEHAIRPFYVGFIADHRSAVCFKSYGI